MSPINKSSTGKTIRYDLEISNKVNIHQDCSELGNDVPSLQIDQSVSPDNAGKRKCTTSKVAKKKSTTNKYNPQRIQKSQIQKSKKKFEKVATFTVPFKHQPQSWDKIFQEPLSHIPLTPEELNKLFYKYQLDGHFRSDGSLPLNFVEFPKNDMKMRDSRYDVRPQFPYISCTTVPKTNNNTYLQNPGHITYDSRCLTTPETTINPHCNGINNWYGCHQSPAPFVADTSRNMNDEQKTIYDFGIGNKTTCDYTCLNHNMQLYDNTNSLNVPPEDQIYDKENYSGFSNTYNMNNFVPHTSKQRNSIYTNNNYNNTIHTNTLGDLLHIEKESSCSNNTSVDLHKFNFSHNTSSFNYHVNNSETNAQVTANVFNEYNITALNSSCREATATTFIHKEQAEEYCVSDGIVAINKGNDTNIIRNVEENYLNSCNTLTEPHNMYMQHLHDSSTNSSNDYCNMFDLTNPIFPTDYYKMKDNGTGWTECEKGHFIQSPCIDNSINGKNNVITFHEQSNGPCISSEISSLPTQDIGFHFELSQANNIPEQY